MTGHHDANHSHTHGDGAETDLADLLDLDGEVLRSYWTDAVTWVERATTRSVPRRILDLGAGTGTGTIALAQCFVAAEVIAVDSSEEMLGRIHAKALDLELSSRIRTIHADLDLAWPALDPIDLTWASMSMHHMANPDRVLSNLFAVTRPGGLLAVVEFDEPLRFLSDDVGIGRPGLETRCLEARAQEHAHPIPEFGSEWAPRLLAAGFTDIDERAFRIELNPPLSRATVDYARGWLQRLRSRVAYRLDSQDQEALDQLIDGIGVESLQHQEQFWVRGTRTITLGRRP